MLPWKRIPSALKRLHVSVLMLVLSNGLLSEVAAEQSPKEVRSEADLPRTVYSMNGSVGRLLQSEDSVFAPLLEKPAARIVVFRFNDGLSRELSFPPTGEWAERMAANFRGIGAFCRNQQVRVVNMSWGDDLHEFEVWLARTKAGQDADQRKEEATKLFAIWKQAIYDTIKSAASTLFVTSARK